MKERNKTGFLTLNRSNICINVLYTEAEKAECQPTSRANTFKKRRHLRGGKKMSMQRQGPSRFAGRPSSGSRSRKPSQNLGKKSSYFLLPKNDKRKTEKPTINETPELPVRGAGKSLSRPERGNTRVKWLEHACTTKATTRFE